MGQGLPLSGTSCYSIDYVRYPATPRRRPFNHSLYGTHFLTHAGDDRPTSSYKTHFAWPHAKPAASAGSDDASVLTAASKGHKFNGLTRYKEDYDAKRWEAAPPPKASGDDAASTLTDAVARAPFEGLSTYADHYVKYPDTVRQSSARPANGVPPEQSFAGDSEYRQKYNENATRQPKVHLKRIY